MFTLDSEAWLLRIFIGESDRHGGRPLYHAIVDEARRQGLAGATVLHGALGYGANSRIHSSHILRLSEDLPVVIEIIESRARLEAFLPALNAMMGEGLVTIGKVEVLVYRHSKSKAE